MRKRSFPILLVAFVGWILVWRVSEELMLVPLGYKMSGPLSASTYLRLTGLFAFVCSLFGLLLLTVDFARWVKGRER